MWKKIEKTLRKLSYFEVSEVAQLLMIENSQASQVLSRWVKSGRVVRVKRGRYVSYEGYLSNRNELDYVGMIASIVQPSSYLSREYVLQKHGVLSEASYLITSMTSKNTQSVTNVMGTFESRHIKASLYGGYYESVVGGVTVREASLAKALFDYLYLRRGAWLLEKKSYDLAEDMRLNLDDWDEDKKRELEQWVEKAESKKMSKVLANLRENIWQ
ncbi:MAG: hypothetical protein DRP57_12345 [Spirochaetes bacterium]|nr:MAG: hypothetical protein DRP57_12345 [Spirochaetota bacterium]